MHIQTRTEKRAAIRAVISPSFSFHTVCGFLFPLFLYGEILFTKVYPAGEACGSQFLHVLVHFRVGHLRVNLRGGNGGVSHHAAYSLYRYAERKGNMGAEIMPREVGTH